MNTRHEHMRARFGQKRHLRKIRPKTRHANMADEVARRALEHGQMQIYQDCLERNPWPAKEPEPRAANGREPTVQCCAVFHLIDRVD